LPPRNVSDKLVNNIRLGWAGGFSEIRRCRELTLGPVEELYNHFAHIAQSVHLDV